MTTLKLDKIKDTISIRNGTTKAPLGSINIVSLTDSIVYNEVNVKNF